MLIIVKPAKENVKVRKQDGAHLPVDGEQVEKSAFWTRRVKDGDVIMLSKEEAEVWAKAREDAKEQRRKDAAKVKAQMAKDAAEKAKAEKAKTTETKGE